MGEDVYAVDADDLAALVDDLARGHAALTELAADLARRIAGLHDCWAGTAADAHATAQARAGTLNTILAAAATNLQMWEQVR